MARRTATTEGLAASAGGATCPATTIARPTSGQLLQTQVEPLRDSGDKGVLRTRPGRLAGVASAALTNCPRGETLGETVRAVISAKGRVGRTAASVGGRRQTRPIRAAEVAALVEVILATAVGNASPATRLLGSRLDPFKTASVSRVRTPIS